MNGEVYWKNTGNSFIFVCPLHAAITDVEFIKQNIWNWSVFPSGGNMCWETLLLKPKSISRCGFVSYKCTLVMKYSNFSHVPHHTFLFLKKQNIICKNFHPNNILTTNIFLYWKIENGSYKTDIFSSCKKEIVKDIVYNSMYEMYFFRLWSVIYEIEKNYHPAVQKSNSVYKHNSYTNGTVCIYKLEWYLDFNTTNRYNSFEMSVRNLKSWSQKGISHTVVKISPR